MSADGRYRRLKPYCGTRNAALVVLLSLLAGLMGSNPLLSGDAPLSNCSLSISP
jgi:hypothetical protein